MNKLLLVILILPFSLNSQNIKSDSTQRIITSRIDSLENKAQKIKELEKMIQNLEKNHNSQASMNEMTLNSISNQISSASYNLTLFGVLFGVAALGLGAYITFIERKTISIREENRSLLAKTKQIKDEVVNINELIQKDIYGLYIKIKREESLHILNRLNKVPKDITNLMNELLSRELKEEDYYSLKKAYAKLKKDSYPNTNKQELKDYQLLFFQHFLDLSTMDEEINDDLIPFYEDAISCAFENDIVKSTEDFMKAVIDLGYQIKGTEINHFMTALSKSEFKDFKLIYEIIFKQLANRSDRFKFYDILEEKEENEIARFHFGSLLLNQYSDQKLSESEKNTLGSIEKLIEKEINKENEKVTSELN